MFQIYLPIAEIPVNILGILALGVLAGILAGMFGVGGGFLMTPLLIFIGIPPAVAVSSTSNQIIASSVSGFLAHWRRRNVDIRMGFFMLVGGLVGSSLGVLLFAVLKNLGQIDLAISITYVLFLSFIGVLMAVESRRSMLDKKAGRAPRHIKHQAWMHRLPFKAHFPRSKLYISILLPVGVGFVTGLMVSLMGIGGGFVMIPAMIYLLGMPTTVVVGTSLFQIIFITCNVTWLQAVNTQTVDIVLAVLLLLGSVVGAQIGTKLSMKMAPELLRALLSALVLFVALKLGYGLFVRPEELYAIDEIMRG